MSSVEELSAWGGNKLEFRGLGRRLSVQGLGLRVEGCTVKGYRGTSPIRNSPSP